MAVGFLVSGWGTTPTTTEPNAGDVNIQELLATPAPEETAPDASSGDSTENADAAGEEGSTTE